MPIYEYQCRQCGHQLEAFQKMSDAPLTECPECKGSLSKLISATSFQLKGTGWYATDFRNKNKPADANKPADENKSVSNEAKPEVKSTETKSTGTDSSTTTDKK